MIYSKQDSTLYHFYQIARYGLSSDIPRYDKPKNWVEKVGDIGLWTIENFPGKIWRLMKEPRWITVVLSNLSLLSVSFLFYRQHTIDALKGVVKLIPSLPTREQAKFGLYLAIIAHIVSATLRAYGRFRNDDLMTAWYTDGGKNKLD